ncbi:MAG: hypothetical protein EON58_05060 [Alphaproteobacteria bacterium]|nr:MAG: hypothetical protein EON58_05060 [Alphaproteobacteria bacterium]
MRNTAYALLQSPLAQEDPGPAGLGATPWRGGLKAWSQNLGHDVLITLKSYGELPPARQRELIRAADYALENEAALQLGREMLASMRAKKVA